jgi:hypothetical protein
MIRIWLALSALSFATAGCAVAPFDAPIGKVGYPRVNQILDRIQCEIAEARDSPTINSYKVKERMRQQNLQPFDKWVASVILTLTVNDTEGLSPSTSGLTLAVIDPLKLTNNSFGFGGSVILYQQRARTFTQQYSLQIDSIPINETCENIEKKWHDFNLEGDLGLREQIYTGLHAFDKSEEGEYDVTQKAGSPDGFGATVSFDIYKGLGSVGPTWTLVRFKTTGGVGVQRDDLHKIAITFVPVALPSAQATVQTQATTAGDAMGIAQDMNQQLVLRQILNAILQAQNKP